MARWLRPLQRAGREALKYHTEATATYPTLLNGAQALLICYRIELQSHDTNDHAIHELCTRFRNIGDWCAGYGHTAAIAREHGINWVASDHNGSCIAYIAERFA